MSNSNFQLPTHWSSWAIIGAIIFLILLATHHAATAFTGLFFIGFIFILVPLADSGFSSGFLWIVLLVLFALILILGLGYVPAEWQPQPATKTTTHLLITLYLLV
jgi:uncharacterized membrane protein